MGIVSFQGGFRIHGGIAVRAAMGAGVGHADVAAQGAAAVLPLRADFKEFSMSLINPIPKGLFYLGPIAARRNKPWLSY